MRVVRVFILLFLAAMLAFIGAAPQTIVRGVGKADTHSKISEPATKPSPEIRAKAAAAASGCSAHSRQYHSSVSETDRRNIQRTAYRDNHELLADRNSEYFGRHVRQP